MNGITTEVCIKMQVRELDTTVFFRLAIDSNNIQFFLAAQINISWTSVQYIFSFRACLPNKHGISHV